MGASPCTCSGAAYCGVNTPAPFERQRSAVGIFGAALAGIIVEQLGNPEIQEFDRAVRGHQDVRGFEIAMDHEVGVRMGHGGHHLKDEADALRRGASARSRAVGVDRHPVDVFEHQIGLAGATDSGIEQPGDAGMREPGEHRPLPAKPLLAGGGKQRQG